MEAEITLTPYRKLSIDLENRPLAYWYPGATTAQITAFGWMWEDEGKPHSMVLRNFGGLEDEKGVIYPYALGLQMFVQQLESGGIVYAHNLREHDLRLLMAARMKLKQPKLKPILTSDTLKDCVRVKDMSRSLENLAKRFELPGVEKKHMSVVDWESANELGSDGVEEARERVTTDVLLQKELRDELRRLEYLKPPRIWKP